MPANQTDEKAKETKVGDAEPAKAAVVAAEGGNGAKKKRNKKKKKKKFVPRGVEMITVEEYRDRAGTGQTYPPSRPVATLYPERDFPVGELINHPGPKGKGRRTETEKEAQERTEEWEKRLEETREAAEIHRQVRMDAQRFIQPGKTMVEICERIESTNKQLLGLSKDPKVVPPNPLARGWGFPTGCSLNSCAAHWTPNTGDDTVLKKDDIVKIDFGTQINGRIIDCAFTLTFDPKHDELMKAVKAATNTGIKCMGIDARLGEVGAAIQEVMESFSCEYNGQLHPVKAIKNLCGHSIDRYRIHAGKSVPIVKTGNSEVMVEGELYAIETFGSVMGSGEVWQEGVCSHFMKDFEHEGRRARGQRAQKLFDHINHHHGTLAFCRRWLDDAGQTRHLGPLKSLVDQGIVREYPPLCDKEGSFTAQYEHTIVLRPTCKEVVSRGPDF